MIQPVIPHRSVVTLNVGVLLSVTLLDKHELNTFVYAQVASKLLMYSGPLSQRIRLGWPRHSMI